MAVEEQVTIEGVGVVWVGEGDATGTGRARLVVAVEQAAEVVERGDEWKVAG